MTSCGDRARGRVDQLIQDSASSAHLLVRGRAGETASVTQKGVASRHPHLVRKAVEGACETVETGGEREVGVRQSRADQVGGVGRHVTTLCKGETDKSKAVKGVDRRDALSRLPLHWHYSSFYLLFIY